MKITHRQLKKIIKEGIFDLAGNVFDIATEEDFKSWGSDDAFELWNAMQGLGTDEETIKQIMSKRLYDLDQLYKEYNLMLQKLVQHIKGEKYDAHRLTANLGTFGVRKLIQNLLTTSSDHDLIEWLIEDGMDEEAELVQSAITLAGTEREKPAAYYSS